MSCYMYVKEQKDEIMTETKKWPDAHPYEQLAAASYDQRIIEWAHNRGLIQGGNTDRQFLKLSEEVGELAAGLARNNQAEVVDALGDIYVVITILAAQRGMDINECIEHAWQEIKDRKGRLVNGVFIKEEA